MTLLLESGLKSAAIIAIALALMPLCRRQTAALRHAILAAALLGAALTPLTRGLVPAWRLPVGLSRIVPAGDATSALHVPGAIDANSQLTASDVSTSMLPSISTIVVAVWLAGLTISLAVLIVGSIRLARLTSRARTLAAMGIRTVGTIVRINGANATPRRAAARIA